MKRQSLKKVILSVLTGIILFSGIAAKADLIYEPEDDFFRKHRKECISLDMTYNGLGPEGYVVGYKSPVSYQEVMSIENAANILVSYTYEDGNGRLWGLTERYVKEEYKNVWTSCWIPMDNLFEKYSTEMFFKEYRKQITEEPGSLEITEGTACIYSYPGEGAWISSRVEAEKEEAVDYRYVYTDSLGNRWALALSNPTKENIGWICLNAPTEKLESIYPEGIPVVDTRNIEKAKKAYYVPEGQNSGNSLMCWILLGVGFVAAGAAAVIILMKKGKEKSEKKEFL